MRIRVGRFFLALVSGALQGNAAARDGLIALELVRGPRRRSVLLLGVVAVTACAAPRMPTPVAPTPRTPPPSRGSPPPDMPRGPTETVAPSAVPVRKESVPAERALMTRPALAATRGEATYYADKFDGRRTASGIVFRNSAAYAAHRTYPFGTVLRVTNTSNQRRVIVRVVDRGPHGTSARARRTIIDLSRSIAERLGFVRAGRAPVLVEVMEWGKRRGR